MVVGRFAPSPTGPLHAGSLVAALASWLDARAQDGHWRVRIEDVDTPRCVPGTDAVILSQLSACGLVPDGPVVWQSKRSDLYTSALGSLMDRGLAYGCACSRKDIDDTWAARGVTRPRHGELVYPGTCRTGLNGRSPRAWRLRVGLDRPNQPPALATSAHSAINLIANLPLAWNDRRLGPQSQDVATEVGDFVLRRADGLWAYQLAVVVDDADQGVTHVVRGEDLADNTPRQILLQQALGLPTPVYLHTPLVFGANGEKLSKQNGAQALDLRDPLRALDQAARTLGLPACAASVPDSLAQWVRAWPATVSTMRTQAATGLLQCPRD